MTQKEAIDVLLKNVPKCCKMVDGRYQGGFDNWDCDMGQAIKIAVLAIQDVRNYKKIGTVEECREAAEKQKPKIPIFEHMLGEWTGKFRCPICKKVVTHDCRDTKNTFCENCGQAIQWDENLE